jgi:hypothetical protein
LKGLGFLVVEEEEEGVAVVAAAMGGGSGGKNKESNGRRGKLKNGRGYYLFLCDYKNSVLHPSFQK